MSPISVHSPEWPLLLFLLLLVTLIDAPGKLPVNQKKWLFHPVRTERRIALSGLFSVLLAKITVEAARPESLRRFYKHFLSVFLAPSEKRCISSTQNMNYKSTQFSTPTKEKMLKIEEIDSRESSESLLLLVFLLFSPESRVLKTCFTLEKVCRLHLKYSWGSFFFSHT